VEVISIFLKGISLFNELKTVTQQCDIKFFYSLENTDFEIKHFV
jgi:hypothetical protein